jgi:acyl-CoA thioesterase YciA
MASKQLIVSKLCKTLDLGVNGNLFGGRLLEWLDEAGAIFAYKQVRGYVVTVKVSEVLFKIPVHERDIIDILGSVKEIGHTSITLEMDAVNVRNGMLVCSCEITRLLPSQMIRVP